MNDWLSIRQGWGSHKLQLLFADIHFYWQTVSGNMRKRMAFLFPHPWPMVCSLYVYVHHCNKTLVKSESASKSSEKFCNDQLNAPPRIWCRDLPNRFLIMRPRSAILTLERFFRLMVTLVSVPECETFVVWHTFCPCFWLSQLIDASGQHKGDKEM